MKDTAVVKIYYMENDREKVMIEKTTAETTSPAST